MFKEIYFFWNRKGPLLLKHPEPCLAGKLEVVSQHRKFHFHSYALTTFVKKKSPKQTLPLYSSFFSLFEINRSWLGFFENQKHNRRAASHSSPPRAPGAPPTGLTELLRSWFRGTGIQGSKFLPFAQVCHPLHSVTYKLHNCFLDSQYYPSHASFTGTVTKLE